PMRTGRYSGHRLQFVLSCQPFSCLRERTIMRRLLLVIFLLSLAGGALFLGRPPAAPGAKKSGQATPEWIWITAEAKDNERAFFRKTFEIKGPIKSAVVTAACDNHVTLFVNGKHLLQHDEWSEPASEKITEKLHKGKNVLAARCSNDGGPAGFLLHLSIELADGSKQTVVTDTSWLAAADPKEDWRKLDYNAAGWKKSHSLGKMGIAPWGDVALGSGRGASATLPEAITTAPGFRVELLYSVPKGKQGSWVSMTPDPRGRLIVSDQYGSLYRVTPG